MLLLTSLALACPASGPALDHAADALLAGSPAEADLALAQAAQSFGCAPATLADLGRYWLVEGVRFALAGDATRATRAFAASRRVDPSGWDPRFGASLKVTYDAAGAEGPGYLTVDANHASARIDTLTPASWPAEIAGGVHLVQIVSPDGATVAYGKLVRVVEGEEVLVETGLPELPPEAIATTAPVGLVVDPAMDPAMDATVDPVVTRRRSPWWFVAAGVAAGGAGALYYLAYREEDDLGGADDLGTLDAAWARQRGFTGGAVALSGAAAFGVVGYFVF
jgi:hypothetical protein